MLCIWGRALGVTQAMIRQFDEDYLVEFESSRCISCGCTVQLDDCVKCRAESVNASTIATMVIMTRDSIGNIIDVREEWVH